MRQRFLEFNLATEVTLKKGGVSGASSLVITNS